MKGLHWLLLLCVGCASIPVGEVPERLPILIYQPPLPAYSTPVRELRLDVKLHITEQGTVDHVSIVNSSGDRDWDALAMKGMREWRYSPALLRGKPVALWITQSLRVQFGDPLIIELAEIQCTSEAQADSVYRRLSEGEDFVALARSVSAAESRERGGMLGLVDIRVYPVHVQRQLRLLPREAWTGPIRLGDTYAFFKRVDGK